MSSGMLELGTTHWGGLGTFGELPCHPFVYMVGVTDCILISNECAAGNFSACI